MVSVAARAEPPRLKCVQEHIESGPLSMSDSQMTTLMKAGRYEIVGELGRGAMGVVYKPVDPAIGRSVAVKAIKLSADRPALTRPHLLPRSPTSPPPPPRLTHPP